MNRDCQAIQSIRQFESWLPVTAAAQLTGDGDELSLAWSSLFDPKVPRSAAPSSMRWLAAKDEHRPSSDSIDSVI
jgi:hypothetical protein